MEFIAMDNQAISRRNLVVLTLAQALGASSAPIIISFGGLVGRGLTSNGNLVTLPVSVYQLGVAVAVLPAAWAMGRWGRRPTYLLGGCCGLLSGLLATAGIVMGAFWLFCLGTMIAGFYNATIQSYRFAATDYAAPPSHSKMISLIMVGALVGSVFGPRLGIWMKNVYDVDYAGSFLSQTFLALLALPVLAFLLAPKATTRGVEGGTPDREQERGVEARSDDGEQKTRGVAEQGIEEKKPKNKLPLQEIVRQKNFVLGASTGAVSYGLMSFLMTASPMAMDDHHHSGSDSALGIQLHILAMFAPSFVTGYLVKYFGAEKITATGLVLIMLSAALALTGYELPHFFSALVFLGIGWNFGFIGSTSLITAHCSEESRVQVQGLNDFIIFGIVAVCSFASGALLNAAGWELINMMVFPIVGLVLLPLLYRLLRRPVAVA